jgi:hypothetical protein
MVLLARENNDVLNAARHYQFAVAQMTEIPSSQESTAGLESRVSHVSQLRMKASLRGKTLTPVPSCDTLA